MAVLDVHVQASRFGFRLDEIEEDGRTLWKWPKSPAPLRRPLALTPTWWKRWRSLMTLATHHLAIPGNKN